MALNPTATESHNWNYSDPEKPGYSLELTGTVVAIQEVQAMNFAGGKPSTPKVWEDTGLPMWNIRFVLAGKNGGIRTWTITPASAAAKRGEVPSVHIDLFKLAGGKDILELIGKTIHIKTVAPPDGFTYGRGKPRPWDVSLVPGVQYAPKDPLPAQYLIPQLLANAGASGGMMPGLPQTQLGSAQMMNQVAADLGATLVDENEEIPF